MESDGKFLREQDSPASGRFAGNFWHLQKTSLLKEFMGGGSLAPGKNTGTVVNGFLTTTHFVLSKRGTTCIIQQAT